MFLEIFVFCEFFKAVHCVLKDFFRAGKVDSYKIFAAFSVFRAAVYVKPGFVSQFFRKIVAVLMQVDPHKVCRI